MRALVDYWVRRDSRSCWGGFFISFRPSTLTPHPSPLTPEPLQLQFDWLLSFERPISLWVATVQGWGVKRGGKIDSGVNGNIHDFAALLISDLRAVSTLVRHDEHQGRPSSGCHRHLHWIWNGVIVLTDSTLQCPFSSSLWFEQLGPFY